MEKIVFSIQISDFQHGRQMLPPIVFVQARKWTSGRTRPRCNAGDKTTSRLLDLSRDVLRTRVVKHVEGKRRPIIMAPLHLPGHRHIQYGRCFDALDCHCTSWVSTQLRRFQILLITSESPATWLHGHSHNPIQSSYCHWSTSSSWISGCGRGRGHVDNHSNRKVDSVNHSDGDADSAKHVE
jgi:hypothetical protein